MSTSTASIDPRIYIASIEYRERVVTTFTSTSEAATRQPTLPTEEAWLDYAAVPFSTAPALAPNAGPAAGPGAPPVELVRIGLEPEPGDAPARLVPIAPLSAQPADLPGYPAFAGVGPLGFNVSRSIPAGFAPDDSYRPSLTGVSEGGARVEIPFNGSTWVIDNIRRGVLMPDGVATAARGADGTPLAAPFVLTYHRYTGATAGTTAGVSGNLVIDPTTGAVDLNTSDLQAAAFMINNNAGASDTNIGTGSTTGAVRIGSAGTTTTVSGDVITVGSGAGTTLSVAAGTQVSNLVTRVTAGSGVTVTGPSSLGEVTISAAGGGGGGDPSPWEFTVTGSQSYLVPAFLAPGIGQASEQNLVFGFEGLPFGAGGIKTSTEGGGTRIQFASDGSFRVGSASTTEWDVANRGDRSVAMGVGCRASGPYSFTVGTSCVSSDENAISMGFGCTASAPYAVAIGNQCVASGQSSVALGNNCDAGTSGSGSFAVGSGCSAVGSNSVAMGLNNSTTILCNSVTGGSGNQINGQYCFIGGGASNLITGGFFSSICGGGSLASGFKNEIRGSDRAFIGGGQLNLINTANFAAIAGGQENTAQGESTFIGGGFQNRAESLAAYSTVAGGVANHVLGGFYGFIGGGFQNVVDTTGRHCFIGGGQLNTIRSDPAAVDSPSNAIVGGVSNSIGSSTASNCRMNAIGGGDTNVIDGGAIHCVIAGGNNNSIDSATGGAIAGGTGNQITAGANNSFVAGSGAVAANVGCFVWSDGTAVSTAGPNEVRFRAGGGFFITTNVATISTDGSTWASPCDRNLKDLEAEVDPQWALAGVESLPLYRWTYKKDTVKARKQIGPTAQDWQARFPLGQTELAIDTLEFDGIALAAIKGLAQRTREIETMVRGQEATTISLSGTVSATEGRVSTLEGRVSTLEGRVSTLEGGVSALESENRALRDALATLTDRLAALEARPQN